MAVIDCHLWNSGLCSTFEYSSVSRMIIDTKSTKILIWIVILSVCHQTPRIVHQLLHHMPFINHDVIVPIYEIALMVMYLVSFLIYSFIGDTLRGEVMKMLKCQKRKNSEVETVSLENWMVGSSLKSKVSS